MTDKPYWQQRRDMKNGKTGAPEAGNKAKSPDLPKSAPTPAKGAGARKSPPTPSKGLPGKRPKIKKRSKKQVKVMKDLKLAYGPYLEKNKFCVIQSSDCTRHATCVNHKKGRGVKEVLDQQTWEPSCNPCNLYIEVHHAWAVENGHKISRHQK
jgi:hypothetical protein